jgi:hypothetical protein
MNSFHKIAAAALALSTVSAAQATTLVFDDLVDTYGDGGPILANMTYNAQTLTYTDSGYLLTLNTVNLVSSPTGAHIGDGTSVAQTYNWHDGGDNSGGAFVTLTRVGGGLFDLVSFDFLADSVFDVSASGYTTLNLGSSSGNRIANFIGVSSVTFRGTNNNQLDNIVVNANTTAAPEPASWAMMVAGFGLVGAAVRRRRTNVAFA